MKYISKTELRLENFEKCCALCDNDCPLGQLFDFSCALQAAVLKKMKEISEQSEKPSSPQQGIDSEVVKEV